MTTTNPGAESPELKPGKLTEAMVPLLTPGVSVLLDMCGQAVTFGGQSKDGLLWTAETADQAMPTLFSYIGETLPDGFISWAGGENPVPGRMVEVEIRSVGRSDGPAEAFDWQHDVADAEQDIIAFRLIDEPEVAEPTPPQVADGGEREGEECYKIGRRDGYEAAIQDVDLRTGGDGEYRFCTDGDPDRHTPDARAMLARIVNRFAALRPAPPAKGEGWTEKFIADEEGGPVSGILIDLPDGTQIWTGECSDKLLDEATSMDERPDESGLFLMVAVKGQGTRVVASFATTDDGIDLARAVAASRAHPPASVPGEVLEALREIADGAQITRVRHLAKSALAALTAGKGE